MLCTTWQSDVYSFKAKFRNSLFRVHPERWSQIDVLLSKTIIWPVRCIARKRCEIGYKLVLLFSNRKSHTDFPSVSKSVTLSDLERLSLRAISHKTAVFGANCRVKFTEPIERLNVTHGVFDTVYERRRALSLRQPNLLAVAPCAKRSLVFVIFRSHIKYLHKLSYVVSLLIALTLSPPIPLRLYTLPYCVV